MTIIPRELGAAVADRYRIERELGVGGMATVYLAEDIKHGRMVALKVLRPELSAAMGSERFPREIKTVAQFNHPHILSLYDSGEVQGFLYYVMPFVDGESLRDRLAREKQLPFSDTIRILREVADALAYSHARGVVHRDIKPGNVLLSGRHAVVTDFGVAKALSASAADQTTTVGIAIGTPQYMAPEQAMGDKDIDYRADIYAIGILGYEMLAGRPPFNAPTAQGILAAQVIEKPEDIEKIRPGTPPLLGDAIMKCLAKNPADRWQTTDELISRLEMVGTTPSGGSTPTDTRPLKAATVRTKTKWGLLIGLTTGLLVVGGAVGGYIMTHTGNRKIEKIGVMPIEDISGKDSVFVAAMHDALTNALTRASVTGVETRSTMMRYKGGTKTIRDVANELALGGVVEATVFRAGDVMRINVQFTNPATSRALWSNTYEKDVKDVLAAQGAVVAQVAAGIDSVLANQTKPGAAK